MLEKFSKCFDGEYLEGLWAGSRCAFLLKNDENLFLDICGALKKARFHLTFSERL